MKRNRSKAWNWVLTLTFVVVMLLGMTVAVSATEYNSDSIKAAGSDGIYLTDGDYVNIVGKTLLIDQDPYVPTSVITIRWEAWNKKENCHFSYNDNGQGCEASITGGNLNDGQWHIAAAAQGSDYKYVLKWVTFYPYASLKNTTTVVHFDGKDWYLIYYDATTVTLLAKECVAASKYNSSGNFVEYSNNPTVKNIAVDNYYNSISAGAKTAVSGSGMFLLTTYQAQAIYDVNPNVLKCSQASGAQYNGWWLCSQGYNERSAAFVDCANGDVDADGIDVIVTLGVRPALELNLSSVIFSSVNLSGGANATVSGGSTSQNYFDVGSTRSPMTTVTYTAKTGYKFPEASSYYTTANGITVARTSDTEVTVSGTPDGVANVTVPDAVHTHSFTYAAGTGNKDNTITATCTAGCPDGYDTNGITLTLNAPTSLTYDGSAKAATISGYPTTAPDNLAAVPTTITYYKSKGSGSTTTDGDALSGAPSGVGNYVAQMTWGGKTASLAFSIAPATLTNVSVAQNGTLTYDGSNQIARVTTAATAVNNQNVSFQYKATQNGTDYSEKVPAFSEAGDHTVYYRADASNHSTVTGSFIVHINKASQTAPSAPPIAASVTSTSVTLEKKDEYQYSIGGTAWQDSNVFENLEPNKEYIFYQRLAGDNNHEPSPASNPTTINTTQYTLFFNHGEGATGKMDPVGVSDNDKFTFPECTFTKPEGKTFIRWEMTGVDGTGGIYVPGEEVTIANNCAINGIITVTAHWDTATSATVTTAPEAKELTYDGTGKGLVTAGAAKNGTMNYVIGTNDKTAPTDGWGTDVPEATLAGTYFVWYKALGDKGYSDSKAKCVTAKINKADQAAPAAPAKASVTTTSITLAETAGCEYSKDKTNWQDSSEFTGLSPDTEYTFYQRLKEDANHNASQPSKATKIRTSAKPQPKTGIKKMKPKEVKAKGKTKLVIRWCKVDGAQGYDIFFSKCGKNTKCTKIKTIKGNKKFSWTKKDLKPNKPYKAYVKAWVKKGGKKKYIAKTPTFHIYTANETKHYTNAKSITVKKAKVSLKAGKTYKIKAKINKINENKKLMPACHTKQLRYMSSNNKIATVDGSGWIKAKSVGTCKVYVFAANGVNKAVKVTVVRK